MSFSQIWLEQWVVGFRVGEVKAGSPWYNEKWSTHISGKSLENFHTRGERERPGGRERLMHGHSVCFAMKNEQQSLGELMTNEPWVVCSRWLWTRHSHIRLSVGKDSAILWDSSPSLQRGKWICKWVSDARKVLNTVLKMHESQCLNYTLLYLVICERWNGKFRENEAVQFYSLIPDSFSRN